MADNQLQKLFDSFPRAIRGQILVEAGLTDYGLAGDIDVKKDPDRILASILWRRAITDDELAVIIRGCGIPIFTGSPPAEITLKVSFSDPSRPQGDGLPITELTAATVFLWEVSLRLAEVFSVLAPEESDACAPPMISRVMPGSVSYVLGGALIPTGLAFMVAACGHSIPIDAQQVAYWGGAFIASLGVVTLAIEWGKARAETRNFNGLASTYAGINDLNAAQADEKRTQAELNRQAIERGKPAPEAPPAPPASLFLLPAIKADSQEVGISFGVGTHLLNRTLLPAAQLKLAAGSPTMSVAPTKALAQKAAAS